MRTLRSGPAALFAVVVAAVLGLVLVPLVRLGYEVARDGGASVSRVVHAPGFAGALEHSLLLAVLVPLFAVPLGASTALLLRRPDVPARGLLRVLAVLPLLVPQFVLGYSWTQAYGRAGFVDDVCHAYGSWLTGPIGLVTVLVIDTAPLCYLLTAATLAVRAQPQLEAAARTSGAGGWTVLRTVVLPLLRPVLAAEVVLTFVLTLESFAAPQVLGAPNGFQTLTTRLYGDLQLGSTPNSFDDAITLALLLVLLAAVLLLPADVLLAARLGTRRTSQAARSSAPSHSSASGLVGGAVLGVYAAFAVVLPLVALVAAALTRAVGLSPTPGNWTLDNFRAALDAPTRVALWHSVQLALLAALLLVLLGSIGAALTRYRAGRGLGALGTLAFATPGSAIAVALLIAYGRELDGTLALVLVAYLAKFWPLAQRTIGAALDRVPPGESQAARVSGAGPLALLRTVWLPALSPALLGAGLLVFVACLHELTMSSLLYSTGNETLAVAVLNDEQVGRAGVTAALAVTLTGLVLAIAALGLLLVRASRRVGHRLPAGRISVGAVGAVRAVGA